jgi:hypothetical protein
MQANARVGVRLRLRRTHAVLIGLVACMMSCNGSQPGGGGGAGKGGSPAAGGQGGPGGQAGHAAGGFGGGGAAGAPARGACTQDSDCVFRAADSCCGSCLASGDAVIGPGPPCAGGACAPPPGGCSCVNHVCARGILPQNAPCDAAQDACGSGLKCCVLCGAVTATFATACAAPSCLPSVNTNGAWVCPQLVD